MTLATTYMGLPLRNPLIVGSSPLTDDLDSVKQLEDAQAAAERRYLVYQQLSGMKVPAFEAFEATNGNGNLDGEESK